MKRKRVVMITGASSGIGKEFALQLDPYLHTIDQFWLIGRDQKRLDQMAQTLKHHPTMILNMDITQEENLDELESELHRQHACVCMLIHCAGYGVMGSFATQNREELLGMIRLNCEALTNLTHRFIPYMTSGSRIISMASSAAFLPQPDFAVYAATKSYVLSFSRALGEELREKGIYVTSVCPGPVNTPFFEIAERNGSTLAIKKWFMVEAQDVVRKALRDSCAKRSLSVYSIPMVAFLGITKYVPHGLIHGTMRWCKGKKHNRKDNN